MGAEGAARSMTPERDAVTTTVLLSAWTFSSLVWSIFTEPHQTVAFRTVLFQPLWLLRIWNSSVTWKQDLTLFLLLHDAYGLLWTGSWKLTSLQRLIDIDVNNHETQIYVGVFVLLAICAVAAGSITFRGQQLKTRSTGQSFREQRIDEALLPPLIITSRTTHSRMFPRKHSFSYSYLFVGVPIGFQGRAANVLSVDSPRPCWFDIRGADFLDRNDELHTLNDKLRRYLHAKGVTSRDYAFAYLVTAPRFLGYSFNPVSFWYLYDSHASLKYMILEVNNTFDERRMYLLKSDHTASDEESESKSGEALIFTDSWEKDFHVSPFNSRKGSYSLKAIDPLAAYERTGQIKIDNTIVLKSSKEHPKIVARVFSEGAPREPEKITTSELVKFIAGWWWVGLATFPRIVWQAQKLLFRRKLHVWYRPEVVQTSIGRVYTAEERSLERIFRAFLTQSVEHAERPLRVIYEPAHHHSEEIVLYSSNFTYKEDHASTLTLKVTSPAFYSRFVHYAHAKEAFDRECLFTDEKNRTLSIDGAQALPDLLHAMKHASRVAPDHSGPLSAEEVLRWALLRRLRCPPTAASYPESARRASDQYTMHDIRSFHFSEMDHYVQQTKHKRDYRRKVLKLFLAERFAMGVPILITFWDCVLRGMMLLAAMWFCDNARVWDILRARPFHKADLWTSGTAILLANSIHLWSLVKG
ncbi:hypothetical protein Slin15195_G025050 [Septoria linicola]|uniref:DUF1365-domain-containing protein n=1 Tax=Septoria linicola TaxID=215465 RepID=A0A9Q9EEV4_9PEZI|nr:hypothetical protein Slin14017_G024140 [Septoria linicola]USW49186.1 hypothetical protein Slin15195_G025050 [Septoria linicola]